MGGRRALRPDEPSREDVALRARGRGCSMAATRDRRGVAAARDARPELCAAAALLGAHLGHPPDLDHPGGGGAIRRISLTHTVGADGTTCNDWAGFCDAGLYPGDVLVERKTTGRWEWNAGVGLSFSLGGGESFFVEARYMEVETPVPTAFVPIRVGFML